MAPATCPACPDWTGYLAIPRGPNAAPGLHAAQTAQCHPWHRPGPKGFADQTPGRSRSTRWAGQSGPAPTTTAGWGKMPRAGAPAGATDSGDRTWRAPSERRRQGGQQLPSWPGNQSRANPGGRCRCHSVTCCQRAPSASRVASLPGRPTSWMPNGKPAASRPAGSVIAGSPR